MEWMVMRPTTMLSVWCARLSVWALGFGLFLCALHSSCLPDKKIALGLCSLFLARTKRKLRICWDFLQMEKDAGVSVLTRARVLEKEDDGGVSRRDWGSHQRTSFNLSMLGIELGLWFFHWHSVQVHTPI